MNQSTAIVSYVVNQLFLWVMLTFVVIWFHSSAFLYILAARKPVLK